MKKILFAILILCSVQSFGQATFRIKDSTLRFMTGTLTTKLPQVVRPITVESLSRIDSSGKLKMLVVDTTRAALGLKSVYWMNIPAGGSGGGVPISLSALIAATGTNDINNANYGQIWRWNSLSTGTALTLATSSTASTDAGHTLLGIDMQGANANSGQTTYGASFSNSHTGTSSTNIGLLLQAYSGTNNYALDLGVAGSNTGRMRLNGATSGSIVIQPAAAAGTYTLTLPTTDGTSGQFLQTDGSGVLTWADPSGGGGSPGGSNKQFQFNNSSAFGGSSNLTQETNQILVTGSSNAVVPFVVKQPASHGVNTQEWQTSGGTALAYINQSGRFNTIQNISAFYGLTQMTTIGYTYTGNAGVEIGASSDAVIHRSATATLTAGVSHWKFDGRMNKKQGADVASAAGAITLGSDGNVFEITGTSSITAIVNTNWQNGATITLLFTSTATLVDGTANSGTSIGFELAGNTDFTATADDVITLVLSEIGGTQRWREVSRSVN